MKCKNCKEPIDLYSTYFITNDGVMKCRSCLSYEDVLILTIMGYAHVNMPRFHGKASYSGKVSELREKLALQRHFWERGKWKFDFKESADWMFVIRDRKEV